MMNQYLVTAIVECCVFFGTAGDDQVDPDAAVSQLESIAHILKDMSNADKVEFEKMVSEIADLGRQSNMSTDKLDFINSLVANLGLT